MNRSFDVAYGGHVDTFKFDNGYELTIARHYGTVGQGKFWEAIIWNKDGSMYSDRAMILMTFRCVADYIDTVAAMEPSNES